MPTIEGKEAKVWVDAYVSEAGKLAPVATAVRALIKKAAAGCEEYVSPWKTPAFDVNGPLCVFVIQKEHVSLAFLRGAVLYDPEGLLEGNGKGVRNLKLRTPEDVKQPALKKLIEEAVKLNKKDPPSGKMVGMDKRRKIESKKK
jgi:hypothetical protein